MTGVKIACDDCVPRGCICQTMPRNGNWEDDASDNWEDIKDEHGRKMPCIEWWRI